MTASELCERLERLEISANDLAVAMGVTARAVRWWKAGQRTIPELAIRQALDRVTAQRAGYRQGRADAAMAAQDAILRVPRRVTYCRDMARPGSAAAAATTEDAAEETR